MVSDFDMTNGIFDFVGITSRNLIESNNDISHLILKNHQGTFSLITWGQI